MAVGDPTTVGKVQALKEWVETHGDVREGLRDWLVDLANSALEPPPPQNSRRLSTAESAEFFAWLAVVFAVLYFPQEFGGG